MDLLLTDNEVRVLGCLMEKEMATPDYYPLSLNALINGCNQKSNRNPVVSFDENTVLYALQGLLERKLVRQSNVGRVTKYEQLFSGEINLIQKEQAVICILLLRGPQTLGEIRSRTERLYSFDNLEEVQETISNLDESNHVKKLSRQPGRKESRYSHTLSGDPVELQNEQTDIREVENIIVRRRGDQGSDLEEQVKALQEEIRQLREEFAAFKAQFE